MIPFFSNLTAIPCTIDVNRPYCLRSPGVIFGVYLPWAFIGLAAVLCGCALAWDWKRGRKAAFAHITAGNVRIVSGSNNRR